MKRFVVKAQRDELGGIYSEPLVKFETDNEEEAKTYCFGNDPCRHFILDTVDGSKWHYASGWFKRDLRHGTHAARPGASCRGR